MEIGGRGRCRVAAAPYSTYVLWICRPGKRSATRLKVYACVSSQSSSVYSVAPAVDISINASALSCG